MITLNETAESKQKNNKPKKEPVKLDRIIKLLLNVSDKTLIHTLNGLFNENYNPDDVSIKISKSDKEFIKNNIDLIIADTFLKLETISDTRPHHYHIEYQLSGENMSLRVFEYAIMKTLENARVENSNKRKKRLYMPRSLVIHFTESKGIPDKYEVEIVFPDGDVKEFFIDVLKFWEYDAKKLINKNLFVLLPLQLFLLRKELDKISADNKEEHKAALSKAQKAASAAIDTITTLYDEKKFDFYDYDKLVNGLSHIIQHLDTRYNFNKKLSGGVENMLKTLIDPKIVENERIEIAKGLFDVLDVKIIAEKTKLPLKKIKELKKEYLNSQDIKKATETGN